MAGGNKKSEYRNALIVEKLGQHRIMGQGDSARDFGPSESMENVGILCVFPIFHTARLRQKIRRSPPLPLCGVALDRENLTMPKGRKETVKTHAEAQGESLNAFINRAITETMERDDSGEATK